MDETTAENQLIFSKRKKKKKKSHTQETKKTSSWYSEVKTMNGGEGHFLAQASQPRNPIQKSYLLLPISLNDKIVCKSNSAGEYTCVAISL